MGKIKVDVSNCARCNGNHTGLWFTQLTNEMPDSGGFAWTHWAPCPENGEPVLLRLVLVDGTGGGERKLSISNAGAEPR